MKNPKLEVASWIAGIASAALAIWLWLKPAPTSPSTEPAVSGQSVQIRASGREVRDPRKDVKEYDPLQNSPYQNLLYTVHRHKFVLTNDKQRFALVNVQPQCKWIAEDSEVTVQDVLKYIDPLPPDQRDRCARILGF